MKNTGWFDQWWLFLLLAAMILLFLSLGIWQMNRAHEKSLLMEQIESNQKIHSSRVSLHPTQFTRIELEGEYDGQFYWWDNRTSHGRAGYELLVLLKISNSEYSQALVNLGFVADTMSRTQLPDVPHIPKQLFWQTQVRSIDLHWLQSQLVSDTLPIDQIAPVLFELEAGQPFGQQSNWHPIKISPQKHMAYAVQWFSLAITLILANIVLIVKQRQNNKVNYEHSL